MATHYALLDSEEYLLSRLSHTQKDKELREHRYEGPRSWHSVWWSGSVHSPDNARDIEKHQEHTFDVGFDAGDPNGCS